MKTKLNPIELAGIALILMTGLIHLIEAPDAFGEAPYKGILFVLNGVGALISAVGIFRGVRKKAWLLGIAVAGGSILGYIASRTVGLPGIAPEPDAWLEPLGVASLVVEGLFVVLATKVLRTRR